MKKKKTTVKNGSWCLLYSILYVQFSLGTLFKIIIDLRLCHFMHEHGYGKMMGGRCLYAK